MQEHIATEIHKALKRNTWYEGIYELFEQGRFPIDCPWQFNDEVNPSYIVQTTFRPILTRMPRTLRTLLERCRRVFALKESDRWFLIYVGEPKKPFFCGGQPTLSPKMPHEVVSDGWHLPSDLRLFYSAHNGFGPLMYLDTIWTYESVLPDRRLSTLDMLFGRTSDTEFLFDSKCLLEFFPDGSGNGQYFYRQPDEKQSNRTVDWDHEDRSISREREFWDFVDERLSKHWK
jgi:hypothetical protein